MKKVFIVLSVFSALALAAVAAVKTMFPPEKIRAFITGNISKNLGREARLGDIRVGIFKGIEIRDFAISESPGFASGTFIETRAFVLKFALRPLLRKKVVIHEVVLDSPRITVIQNADGKTFNFSDLASPKPGKAEPKKPEADKPDVQPLSITVTHAEIKEGKINFIDKSTRKINLALDPVNLTVKVTEITKPMILDLKAKAFGTYEGKEIRADLGLKCVIDLLAARIKVENLALNLPELDLDAKGEVSNFSKPELDISLTVKKIDLKSIGRWVEIPKEVSVSISPSIQASLKGGIENPKCSLNIQGLSAKYGKCSLEKVGAEIKASAREAEIVKLTGLLGAEGKEASDFVIKASIKDFSRPDIMLDADFKALDLAMFLGEEEEKKKGTSPSAPPAETKAPPYKGPVIKFEGQVKIGRVIHSKFEGRNVLAFWKLSGVTPPLDKINGTASFEMKDGRINKIPLLSALIPVLRMDPSTPLAFTRLGGSADISKGTAKTDDFKIESPAADISAQGTLYLPANIPDMILTVRLPKGSISGVAGELAGDAAGIPTFIFKLKGSWKPALDVTRVGAKTAQKAAEVLQNEGKKLLEGLFKR